MPPQVLDPIHTDAHAQHNPPHSNLTMSHEPQVKFEDEEVEVAQASQPAVRALDEKELRQKIKKIFPNRLRIQNDSNCFSCAKEVALWLGEGRENPSEAKIVGPTAIQYFVNEQDDGPELPAYGEVISDAGQALIQPQDVYYIEEGISSHERSPRLLLRVGILSDLQSDLEKLDELDFLNHPVVITLVLNLKNGFKNKEGTIINDHLLNLYVTGEKGNRKFLIIDASTSGKEQLQPLKEFMRIQGSLYQDVFHYRFFNPDLHLKLRAVSPKPEILE